MAEKDPKEIVHGYEVKKAVVFSNDRGFALGENQNAVQPFVTWQFTEEANGKRDYYWGHYFEHGRKAERDFEFRIAEHQTRNGVAARSVFPEMEQYSYFSTQRPVDIGTFPKTENGPLSWVNFDERLPVENGAFRAWGILTYSAPLTEKQIDDYELRGAISNPDIRAVMEEQAQIVGHWEEMKGLPDSERFTWRKPSIQAFALREPVVRPEKLEHRYNYAKNELTRTDKTPIAEQLKAGADRAANANAALPKQHKIAEKDR